MKQACPLASPVATCPGRRLAPNARGRSDVSTPTFAPEGRAR
jgi:hypothetical protein